jgi:hypothetical protein
MKELKHGRLKTVVIVITGAVIAATFAIFDENTEKDKRPPKPAKRPVTR